MSNQSYAVYVLVTCRNKALGHGTLLLFESLRTGFPNSFVKCFLNGPMPYPIQSRIINQLRQNQCDVEKFFKRATHSAWIEWLVRNMKEPFFVVDTDVIFWQSIEDWEPMQTH